MKDLRCNSYRHIENAYVDENVEYVRRECECGHVLTFLTKFPRTCTFCGRLVYPSKLCEFKDKMSKEMRKTKYE